MKKALLFQALTAELTKNLELALTAAQATYDIATHEDNKAENKYDTRGLEASYLAGAQAERVRDLKETLGVISILKIKDFTKEDKIAQTALIKIEFNEKESWLLFLPKGGGHSFTFEGKSIKVITPESPLGELLVGKSVDDEVILNGKEYVILEIQ
jgi:transcription elongation GreA/GreB family factor